MKKNLSEIIRRSLSMLLVMVFIFSMTPFTFIPIFAAPDENPLYSAALNKHADPGTNNSTKYFYPSTLENGRIWTDKTVSADNSVIYDIAGNPAKIIDAKPNEFLITLSALSQSYTVDTVVEPTDSVFVLDVSASMYINKLDNEKSRVEMMVEALNAAIVTLMNENPHNRVAVVAFGGDSGKSRIVPILKLGHYNVTDKKYFSMRSAAYIQVSSQIPDSALFYTGDTANRAVRVNGGTPTQQGIYAGAKILLADDHDTAYTYTDNKGKNTVVIRKPNIILLSDGGATIGWTDYKFENQLSDTDNGFDCGDANTTDMGISILTVLTASYCKQQVSEHYYGTEETAKSAGFYTIGLGLGNETGAEAVLDPAVFAENISRVYLSETYNMKQVLDNFINLPAGKKISFPVLKKGSSSVRELAEIQTDDNIKSYNYTDGYYKADKADELIEAFKTITRRIISTGNYVVRKDAEGSPYGTDLIFSDVLGENMEFKASQGLYFDGAMYDGHLFARSITSDNTVKNEFIEIMIEYLEHRDNPSKATAQARAAALLNSCIVAGNKSNLEGLFYNSDTDFSNKIKYYADEKRNWVGNYFDASGNPISELPAGAKCIVDLYTIKGIVKDPVSGEDTDLMAIAVHVVTALKNEKFECVYSDGNKLACDLKQGQQAVRWYIPAKLIPMRTVSVKYDESETKVVERIQIKESLPISFIYSVGLKDGLVLSEISDDYKNAEENAYYFYTNDFNEPNISIAFFLPSDTNPYYSSEEDTGNSITVGGERVQVQYLSNNGWLTVPFVDITITNDWYMLQMSGLIKSEYVQLYANGVPIGEPIRMSPSGDFDDEYTWEEMPLYNLTPDKNGKIERIKYTFAEGSLDGGVFKPYDYDINDPGFAFYYFNLEWNEGDNSWYGGIVNYEIDERWDLIIEKKFYGDIPEDIEIKFEISDGENFSRIIKYPLDFIGGKCYIAMPAPGNYTIKEIDGGAVTGYSCNLSVDTDYFAKHTVTDGIALDTVTAGCTVNVTFTNTYTDTNIADLTIKKTFTFTGDELPKTPDDIAFEIVGENPVGNEIYRNIVYYDEFDIDISDKSGELTLTNLRPGEYTITESGGEIAGYDMIIPPDHNKLTVTLEAGEPKEAEFDNNYIKYGELTIKKTITGILDESLDPQDIVFHVSGIISHYLRDDIYYDRYIEYSDFDTDGEYVLTDIHPGDYTITETGGRIGGYTMTMNPGFGVNTVTMAYTDETVSFVNAYEVIPDPPLPVFTIRKIFEGLESSQYPDDIVFNITGADYNKPITYNKFTDGEYIIEDIPSPGDYIITEIGGAVKDYTVEVNHTSGYKISLNYALEDEEEEIVIFSNTYALIPAKLTIKKIFTGITPAKYPDVLFNIKGVDYNKSVAYSNFINGEYTVADIPPGEYTVTESNAAVSGYSLTEEPASGYILQLVPDDDKTITFSNSYTYITYPNMSDIPDTTDTTDAPDTTVPDKNSDNTPQHDATVSVFTENHIWYIRGYEDNTIRPGNNITRAEIAMVFYRLLDPEMKKIAPASKFNDVTGDEWYGLGVNLLAYYGILNGYPDGNYKPNQPITRNELAAVVSRFSDLIETDENPYNDLDPNNWAYKYVLSATKKGWFIGDGNGKFRPEADLTRAEFVTVANRILNRHILPEDIPDGLHKWDDLNSSHWSYADFTEAIYTHKFTRKADGINEEWTEITDNGIDAAYNQ